MATDAGKAERSHALHAGQTNQRINIVGENRHDDKSESEKGLATGVRCGAGVGGRDAIGVRPVVRFRRAYCIRHAARGDKWGLAMSSLARSTCVGVLVFSCVLVVSIAPGVSVDTWAMLAAHIAGAALSATGATWYLRKGEKHASDY